jgi:hypothetical protein
MAIFRRKTAKKQQRANRRNTRRQRGGSDREVMSEGEVEGDNQAQTVPAEPTYSRKRGHQEARAAEEKARGEQMRDPRFQLQLNKMARKKKAKAGEQAQPEMDTSTASAASFGASAALQPAPAFRASAALQPAPAFRASASPFVAASPAASRAASPAASRAAPDLTIVNEGEDITPHTLTEERLNALFPSMDSKIKVIGIYPKDKHDLVGLLKLFLGNNTPTNSLAAYLYVATTNAGEKCIVFNTRAPEHTHNALRLLLEVQQLRTDNDLFDRRIAEAATVVKGRSVLEVLSTQIQSNVTFVQQKLSELRGSINAKAMEILYGSLQQIGSEINTVLRSRDESEVNKAVTSLSKKTLLTMGIAYGAYSGLVALGASTAGAATGAAASVATAGVIISNIGYYSLYVVYCVVYYTFRAGARIEEFLVDFLIQMTTMGLPNYLGLIVVLALLRLNRDTEHEEVMRVIQTFPTELGDMLSNLKTYTSDKFTGAYSDATDAGGNVLNALLEAVDDVNKMLDTSIKITGIPKGLTALIMARKTEDAAAFREMLPGVEALKMDTALQKVYEDAGEEFKFNYNKQLDDIQEKIDPSFKSTEPLEPSYTPTVSLHPNPRIETRLDSGGLTVTPDSGYPTIEITVADIDIVSGEHVQGRPNHSEPRELRGAHGADPAAGGSARDSSGGGRRKRRRNTRNKRKKNRGSNRKRTKNNRKKNKSR